MSNYILLMQLNFNSNCFFDTNEGIDLSLPLKNGDQNVNAWHCGPVKIEPVQTDDFIGDVNQGGPVNFRNIFLNPHGNGTHTECVGHISSEYFTINQCLKSFHFIGRVITIKPVVFWNEAYQINDLCIGLNEIKNATQKWNGEEVLIIRTLPNDNDRKTKDYSNSNPPYFTAEAMQFVNELGVQHLMVDLPSVDRESDQGLLEAHHLFWGYPHDIKLNKTISELLFIPNDVADKQFVVTIQIMSIESDASPSKIIIYPIHER